MTTRIPDRIARAVGEIARIAAPAAVLALAVALPAAGAAQKHGTCNQPMAKPVVFVDVPGRPFEAIPTADGCWIFVSLSGVNRPGGHDMSDSGVAVMKREGGKVSLVRVARIDGHPLGMVTTHDGTLLIAADNEQVDFFDTGRLISGQKDPLLGRLNDGEARGSTYVNVSPDDRYVFVSNERSATITVIDLGKARSSGFKPASVVGKIPVGIAPVDMTFSSDGRYLYTTSELAPKSLGWPVECKEEQEPDSTNLKNPAGAIIVVDAQKARSEPEKSVLATARGGCSPVRVQLSPGGDTAYVTARNNNALLAFSTAKLLTDPAHALVATVPVGTAPVGVAVAESGRILLVANSNRFAGGRNDRQTLSVIDAAKIASGAGAVIGQIPAAAFPREIRITADGGTALVTNFSSGQLEVIDLRRVLHTGK